jgi:endoglucanase
MNRTNKRPLFTVLGTFIIIAGLCVLFLLNLRDILDSRPPEFSKSNMLQSLWHQYKQNYLEWGTLRSLDKQQQSITTSEGQSYTMLRAVWMDDKDTFDKAWQWTKDNLQREDDHLISWLFGEQADGTYGILTARGGRNTATDADQDIALALLYASKRWNDQKYYGDAIGIIRDIWAKEVITINGRPYLLANDIEKSTPKSTVVVNPSYLSPYTYKVFAIADPDHDWSALADTSYEVAIASIESRLDKPSSANLPPDWIMFDKKTGEILPPQNGSGLTTNFSFDALRLPWRFALDYKFTGDYRAKEVLDKIGHLESEWRNKKSIAATYSHDGIRLINQGAPSMYGGTIGFFMVNRPAMADEIYREKLEALYDTNESKWKNQQSYYDENWAWFGMALYLGEIHDLYNLEKR